MNSSYQGKNFEYTNPKAYDQRHKSNPLEYYVYSVWHDFLTREVKKYSRDKTAADLGCGTCEYTQYMTDANKIYAVDISPEMLDCCKQKLSRKFTRESSLRVEFLRGSALTTSILANSCDTVISFGLLEYVEPDLLIKETNRIMQDGGSLLILFPNKYNFHHLVMQFYGKILKKNRKKELSVFAIKRILKKYKFKIEKTESRGMIFYTRGKLQKYCVPIWKFLDFIYSPFQNIFPLGCNIYIKAIKK